MTKLDDTLQLFYKSSKLKTGKVCYKQDDVRLLRYVMIQNAKDMDLNINGWTSMIHENIQDLKPALTFL